MTNNRVEQYINLVDKYQCFSRGMFMQNVPFNEMKKLLRSTTFEEDLKIALRYVRKKIFDIQNKNLYNYFRSHTIPIENTFFENLCEKNNICPKKFATDFISWLTKKDHKINTFRIFGAVNTCKTLIANLLRKIFITSSWLNSSTGSAFNFGNLIYSSLIIIEEPFLPPTLIEDIKSLCGGAPLSVDVKYSQFESLERTPVFITTNFPTLSHGHSAQVSEQACINRAYYYTFNTPLIPTYEIEPGHLLYFLQKHGEYNEITKKRTFIERSSFSQAKKVRF